MIMISNEKTISIWIYKDYKKFLRAIIDAKKSNRGLIRKLSEAAGCQASYISQVLGTKAQLLPDHALGIAEYLGLLNKETKFFLALVDYARASSLRLKARIEERLQMLQVAGSNIKERLGREQEVPLKDQAAYYSSWICSAVHILTSIKEFQTASAIAIKLGLSDLEVKLHLKQLAEMGLVLATTEGWKHSGTELHIPRTSPLLNLHLANWRQKALHQAQHLTGNTGVHFSGIYALSREDSAQLKETVLRCLAEINRVAGPSPCEELIGINIDFFSVGNSQKPFL